MAIIGRSNMVMNIAVFGADLKIGHRFLLQSVEDNAAHVYWYIWKIDICFYGSAHGIICGHDYWETVESKMEDLIEIEKINTFCQADSHHYLGHI